MTEFFSEDEKKIPELSRKLMAEVVKVDFPDPPGADKNGKLKFGEIDERLSWEPPNDMGNMRRFQNRYGDEVLYIERVGWHGWTGKTWSGDEGQSIVERKAQDTANLMKRETLAFIARGKGEDETEKDFYDRVGKFRRFANDAGNMKRINSMISAIKPHVTRLHDVLDKHPALLTVENGTIDLKAEGGPKLLKHNPRDLISKKANVKFDPKADCPNFKKAFAEIQPDVEIQELLQTFFGYCLTGETKEKIVVMFHGAVGDNGKSFLMELMSAIMGTYATRIPIGSLMMQDRRGGGQASPEIARLPGARFITSAEPEEGAIFSDHMIKIVSGEDMIQARHLNEGYIDFFLQGKICISFNKKPGVRAGDEAFWSRVCMIPFDQVFKDADELANFPGAKLKDKELKKKLESEYSGILNWMIEGYLRYRREGFKIPQSVKAAVEEYRLETNNVMEFVKDWCKLDPELSIEATKVYNAYSIWATSNGYTKKFGLKNFSQKLSETRGVVKKRNNKGREYVGIDLTPEGWGELQKWEDSRKQTFSWGKKDSGGVDPADDDQEDVKM